ncbi:MAG: hypothetical protein QM811_28620 [Pirellulales bacterium]
METFREEGTLLRDVSYARRPPPPHVDRRESTSRHRPAGIGNAARRTRALCGSASSVTDRRLRDLIPRKRRYVSALSTIAAATIGVILAAHLWHGELCELLAADALPALDLTAPNNAATWFTGLVLGGASLLAVMIFGLRRFRLDDYRGQYRLWAVVAGMCAAMSVCTVAPLHELWRLICVRATGVAGWEDGSIWWTGPALIAWAAVGTRLAMELRRSPFAMSCFLCGMFCFAIALWARLGEWSFTSLDRAAVVWGAQMLAAATLGIGFVWYARHVLLEVDGLVKPRAKDKTDKPAHRTRRKGNKILSVDPPHGTPVETKKPAANAPKVEAKKEPEKVVEKVTEKAVPRPHFTPTPAAPSKSAPLSAAVNAAKAKVDDDDENEDDDSSSTGGKAKLSRAERKRLRKLDRGE